MHELAHETLHHRDGDTRASKTIRETEAEAVAFVVTHAVSLETGTAESDYIQIYQGNKDTLAASLEHVQQTASAIIQAVVTQDPPIGRAGVGSPAVSSRDAERSGPNPVPSS